MFEFLILEGAQAGIELGHNPEETRRGIKRCFDGFDPAKVGALRQKEKSRTAPR